jgi:hypothetical protein
LPLIQPASTGFEEQSAVNKSESNSPAYSSYQHWQLQTLLLFKIAAQGFRTKKYCKDSLRRGIWDDLP